MASKPPARDALDFPFTQRAFLEPYLPPSSPHTPFFTTLTFATSLDSQLALSPGAPTALSGPQSKAMTHYLRSRHDAILVGVGTAVADDPSLNCRLAGVGGYGGEGLHGQPRPVVVDPSARWAFTEKSKLFALASQGRGRGPFVVTAVPNERLDPARRKVLERCGGKFISLAPRSEGLAEGRENRLDWRDIVKALAEEGLSSVMIEGGGNVINSLLAPEYAELIDSIIVTIAPTWLGRGGVVVSPDRRLADDGKTPLPVARLKNVQWHPFGEDVVLCGRLKS